MPALPQKVAGVLAYSTKIVVSKVGDLTIDGSRGMRMAASCGQQLFDMTPDKCQKLSAEVRGNLIDSKTYVAVSTGVKVTIQPVSTIQTANTREAKKRDAQRRA